MNWLLVIIIGLFVVLALHGYRKGFIKIILSFCVLIFTIVLVSVISPHISDFLQERTSVYENIKDSCVSFFGAGDGTAQSDINENEFIQSSFLPQYIKDGLAANNNPAAREILGAAGFYDYFGAYLAKLILNAISFVIAFIIITIIFRAIIFAAGVISKIPIIKGINKTAGLVLGLLQALIITWVGFIFITIFSNQSFGHTCFTLINDSMFLTFLYENNILMKIIFSII